MHCYECININAMDIYVLDREGVPCCVVFSPHDLHGQHLQVEFP